MADSLLTGSNRTAIVSLAVVAALLLTGIGCYAWGHHGGYGEAEAKGKADISLLRAQYAEGSANATTTALTNYKHDAEAGNLIAQDLVTTRAALAKANADIKRRFNDAAASVPADCVLSPEFISVCEDAFYGVRADAESQSAGSGGVAGGPGETGQARPRVRANTPIRDFAAWLRDMGAYVLELEAVSAARGKLLQERAQ
jgi:hypothetical protein